VIDTSSSSLVPRCKFPGCCRKFNGGGWVRRTPPGVRSVLLFHSALPVATDDTSDSLCLIRICGYVLLHPRLVLGAPNSVRRRRNQRPDPSSGSYTNPNVTKSLIYEDAVGFQLPWWLLVSLGSYSLASLGWGIWSFRDCPEAYAELMQVRLLLLQCFW
jgi:hypothetical protein